MSFAIGAALGMLSTAVRSNAAFVSSAINQRRIGLAFGNSGMPLSQVHAQDKELSLRQTGLGIQHKAVSVEEKALEKMQKDNLKGFSILA